MTDAARDERRLELVSTILPALATVATAWAAYQSRQWTGQQSASTAKATAARIAENRVSALANRQVQIDVATFIQWLNAREEHHAQLADVYRARFRAEFTPAFAAWIATKPFTNKAAPPTPFAMALFFAGLSRKMHTMQARTVILVIGCAVFVGSLVWLATLPVKV